MRWDYSLLVGGNRLACDGGIADGTQEPVIVLLEHWIHTGPQQQYCNMKVGETSLVPQVSCPNSAPKCQAMPPCRHWVSHHVVRQQNAPKRYAMP